MTIRRWFLVQAALSVVVVAVVAVVAAVWLLFLLPAWAAPPLAGVTWRVWWALAGSR